MYTKKNSRDDMLLNGEYFKLFGNLVRKSRTLSVSEIFNIEITDLNSRF